MLWSLILSYLNLDFANKLLTPCLSSRGLRGTAVMISRLVRNSVLEQGGKCFCSHVLHIERGYLCFM